MTDWSLQGRKSRDVEIMYPASPTGIATTPDGFLLVYSDTHIDVFDAAAGEWCQTINIRKTRPLLKSGSLNLSLLQEMPHITYLSNIHKGEENAFTHLANTFHSLGASQEVRVTQTGNPTRSPNALAQNKSPAHLNFGYSSPHYLSNNFAPQFQEVSFVWSSARKLLPRSISVIRWLALERRGGTAL